MYIYTHTACRPSLHSRYVRRKEPKVLHEEDVPVSHVFCCRAALLVRQLPDLCPDALVLGLEHRPGLHIKLCCL